MKSCKCDLSYGGKGFDNCQGCPHTAHEPNECTLEPQRATMKGFDPIKTPLVATYHAINDALRDLPEEQAKREPFGKMSPMNVLYGMELRKAQEKLKEAMHWIRDAEESVG